MEKLRGKKLLLIGATSYFVDVIKAAHELGITTVVTDYNPNAIAKKYADIAKNVNTVDYEAILKLAIEEEVDGVFVGWSDVNLFTAQYVCEKMNFPFYATRDQLRCAVNKDMFKQMCIRNNVPTTKQYILNGEFRQEDLDKIEYPVIVKPVDNGGSRGVTVCESEIELKEAYVKALNYSTRGKIIVEQFLENNGRTFSVKYIIREGVPYLLSVGDRKVLNSEKGQALITSAAVYPATFTQEYIDKMDTITKEMLRNEGFKNGQLFIEGIYDGENFYYYEMGYRLSGGITYRITDALTGINGMKMLIRFALTGEMCSEQEARRIDPFMNKGAACSFAILMGRGKIKEIRGIEEIKKIKEVIDITQYYGVGQTVEERDIGNIGQMFARLSIIADTRERVAQVIDYIEKNLHIIDENNEEMFLKTFDTSMIIRRE